MGSKTSVVHYTLEAFYTPFIGAFLDPNKLVDSKGMLLERSIQDIITHLDHNQEINIFTNTKTYQNTTINALQNDLLDMDYTLARE